MERHEFKDRKGHVITAKKYGDIIVTNNFIGDVKEHLENIKKMETRDGDVYIMTYPKSGTHWTFEIVHMLQNGNTEYFKEMINVFDHMGIDRLEAIPSPRAIVGHVWFRHLPEDKSKCKIIYVNRNPKDVAVSLYSMYKKLNPKIMDYQGEWNDFLEMFISGNVPYGSWFDYELNWQKEIANNPNINILQLQFEDMKQDLEGNVRKIANFLGIKCDNSLIIDIARKCDFKNMSEEKNKNIPDSMKVVFTTGKHSMYRKGEVGDWKNWFTVAQSEYFDSVYNEKMKSSA